VRIRWIVSAAAVLLAAALGIVVSPAAGASALGPCTGTSEHLDDAGATARVPTIGNNTPNFDCLLGVGNVGPAVGDLQMALNSCNGAALSVDNDFGALTKAALQAAQRKVAVTPDGVYGPATRESLHWRDLVGICVVLQ
jgi:peptidoglycan hydrolase-like protein with peptidoglycan-binding domain